MPYNFADLFEHAVDAVPERTALVEDGRRVSFADLDRRANRLAHHLATLGVGNGTHVGYQMHNSIETVETLLACFKLAAVPINVDYRFGVEELARRYADADLEVLIHHATYGTLVRAARAHASGVRHTLCVDDGCTIAWTPETTARYEQVVAAAPPWRPFVHRTGDDLFLIYTETGAPRGVMWRQEDLWRAFGGGIDFCTGERVLDEFQQSRVAARTEPSTWFVLPPLIEAAGVLPTFAALWSGNAVMFTPRFDPRAVWRTVARDRPQVLVLTGDAMVDPLVAAYRDVPVDASSLIAIASGSALRAGAGRGTLPALFPSTVIAEGISSTDGDFGHVGFLQTDVDSAGELRVRPGTGATVVDRAGRPVPAGAEGWLAQTGAVPMGYYKGATQSETLFRTVDGVHVVITGHRARVAEDGTIVVRGGAEPTPVPAPPDPAEGAPEPMPRLPRTVPARFAPFESAVLREHVRRSTPGYTPPRRVRLAEMIDGADCRVRSLADRG